jgi:hypothetical protein
LIARGESTTWADRLFKCTGMLRVLIVVTHGGGMAQECIYKVKSRHRPDTVINRGPCQVSRIRIQTLTPVIGLVQFLHSRTQTGFGCATCAVSQVGDSGDAHDPRLGLRIGIQFLPSHMLVTCVQSGFSCRRLKARIEVVGVA